jgi:hypothetical protein
LLLVSAITAREGWCFVEIRAADATALTERHSQSRKGKHERTYG